MTDNEQLAKRQKRATKYIDYAFIETNLVDHLVACFQLVQQAVDNKKPANKAIISSIIQHVYDTILKPQRILQKDWPRMNHELEALALNISRTRTPFKVARHISEIHDQLVVVLTHRQGSFDFSVPDVPEDDEFTDDTDDEINDEHLAAILADHADFDRDWKNLQSMNNANDREQQLFANIKTEVKIESVSYSNVHMASNWQDAETRPSSPFHAHPVPNLNNVKTEPDLIDQATAKPRVRTFWGKPIH